ncbi:coatomer subunit delta [Nematocida minor]|uniref:coatomer subunit delta n=1 Tax=Nematocida minor TaxID=1912983 RepID=UPI00221E5575|nr:coatomer subunit delta [Nematocida minor]KAI5189418.1 coatomer subunit delta [Nematocida minor]
MLAAVLLVNDAGSYIARPLMDLTKEKVSEAVESFLHAKIKAKESTSALETKIGNFFYQEIDDVYVVVLADKEDAKIMEGLKIVEVVTKSVIKRLSLTESESEIFSIICAVDEIFTREGVVNRTVEEIMKAVSLQSNDEILHQMILKSKEKEKEKAEKIRKMHPGIDELTKEIEEIKILRQDLKVPKQEKAKIKTEQKKHRSILETMDNKINIVTQQKHSLSINSTTEASKIEGVGELHIKITDSEYANIKMNIKNKPKQARAHPSVDKKAFSKNAIIPKTEIPINTSLILMKWTLESPSMPIEVSFWQTEISEERYKFFIEVTALEIDVKSISIRIPIKRVSDIEITNGAVEGDNIVAEISNLEKDDSSAVEFTGLCDDTDSLFPFTVSYVIEEQNTIAPIEISGIYAENETETIDEEYISTARVIEGECTVVNN